MKRVQETSGVAVDSGDYIWVFEENMVCVWEGVPEQCRLATLSRTGHKDSRELATCFVQVLSDGSGYVFHLSILKYDFRILKYMRPVGVGSFRVKG